MLQIHPHQVKNGRIDHVDIGQAIFVDCSNLHDLIEFPPWPHVEIVSCVNCTKVTKLPMWPMVKQVFCAGCYQLQDLPCWKLVRVVDLSYCINLKELPIWPLIKRVFCFGCYQLQSIPSNIKVVHMKNCPFIQHPASIVFAKTEFLNPHLLHKLFQVLY